MISQGVCRAVRDQEIALRFLGRSWRQSRRIVPPFRKSRLRRWASRDCARRGPLCVVKPRSNDKGANYRTPAPMTKPSFAPATFSDGNAALKCEIPIGSFAAPWLESDRADKPARRCVESAVHWIPHRQRQAGRRERGVCRVWANVRSGTRVYVVISAEG